MLCVDDDPDTFARAMKGPDRDIWSEAIREELAALESHGTMQLVTESNIPTGTKILGSKYVFKTKMNDGQVVKHKARLVVLGHRQIPHLHYDPAEIFSPVVAIQSGRTLLSMAASLGWYIRHSDVQAAFVQAPLKDDIYIRLPKRSKDDPPSACYKLLRSLYGIRQAPRVSVVQFGIVHSAQNWF